MDRQVYHEMVLETTHSSGAEEWYCPTCGRRLLLRWPPAYEKIVLVPGDEYAAHSGSKGICSVCMQPRSAAPMAPPTTSCSAPGTRGLERPRTRRLPRFAVSRSSLATFRSPTHCGRGSDGWLVMPRTKPTHRIRRLDRPETDPRCRRA